MPFRLSSLDASFETDLRALIATKREISEDVDATVKTIIDRVKAQGDRAVSDYTREFDRLDLKGSGFALSPERVAEEAAKVPSQVIDALNMASARITAYHQAQKPQDQDYVDPLGVRLGARWLPVSAAGLYVPGGTAAYPSSLLMNAIPAHVAGVDQIVMVVPSPGGELNELVLAAAAIAGVDRAFTGID